ncbi:hypothetical protein EDEG_03770 [Edhazardia aedis USNM 41457]|uniref:Uncharacterized protein n=1 Tax=Edhazardia aedis (strain USNM 41457) TaxID=1003232 RepID=J9D1I6_EDHAE|nr:hypothetical protein EDEG_03770 [Edhazardia aedis USNM 41457]|eukprot:EJW01701.1 hypothetical protein EDEG_03770 [Edhazardia aedis USNM 41457]
MYQKVSHSEDVSLYIEKKFDDINCLEEKDRYQSLIRNSFIYFDKIYSFVEETEKNEKVLWNKIRQNFFAFLTNKNTTSYLIFRKKNQSMLNVLYRLISEKCVANFHESINNRLDYTQSLIDGLQNNWECGNPIYQAENTSYNITSYDKRNKEEAGNRNYAFFHSLFYMHKIKFEDYVFLKNLKSLIFIRSEAKKKGETGSKFDK